MTPNPRHPQQDCDASNPRSFRHPRTTTAALALLLVSSPSAFSRQEASNLDAPTPPGPDIEVTFRPGVWLPRLGGEVAGVGPGPSALMSLDTQIDLDNLEPTFRGELAIRKDQRWDLRLDGFDFSTDVRGPFSGSGTFGSLSLSDGDPIFSELEMTSIGGEVSLWTYRPYVEAGRTSPSGPADLRFSPIAAMRWVEVDHVLEEIGVGRVETGGEWAAALAGVLFEIRYTPGEVLPWLHQLQIAGSGALGPALGGDGGFAWQIRADLTLSFSEHASIFFGYRLLELDVQNDEYEFQAGLQGLFAGGTIRF